MAVTYNPNITYDKIRVLAQKVDDARKVLHEAEFALFSARYSLSRKHSEELFQKIRANGDVASALRDLFWPVSGNGYLDDYIRCVICDEPFEKWDYHHEGREALPWTANCGRVYCHDRCIPKQLRERIESAY